MSVRHWVRDLEEQQWLDPTAERWQGYVRRAYDALGTQAQMVEDLLHGVWLGHPLHAVLTDVVLGSATAGVVLDLLHVGTRNRAVRRCADTALLLAATSGIAAVAAGATDWEHTISRPRRVGFVHALLNVTGLAMLIGSLLRRAQGRRSAGQGLGLAAYTVLSISAYLGGHMAYAMRVGTNRTAGMRLPSDFQRAMSDADLPEGEPKRLRIRGVQIVLIRHEGHIYALADTCSHMGASLSRGILRDGIIQCPWHGSRFKLENGRVIRGPSAYDQPTYETRVIDGMIEVREAPHC